jgi:DNA repair photolyase
MKIQEIQCKTAIGKCGFPGGGLSINPYVGCGHDCAYCYARFMKRFTGHDVERWGSFVDARMNIAAALTKQLRSKKYLHDQIYIGTVTDPYQPIEKKYRLMRGVLEALENRKNSVSILTKSDLVLRDIDLLKKIPKAEVNMTVNTLDERWKELIEPGSPTIQRRLNAMRQLTEGGIPVIAMMGPYWPFFTDPDTLFLEFKKAGVKHVFSESFNTTGGNWTGVEIVLRKHYPALLLKMQKIFFDGKGFHDFYNVARQKINILSKQYKIPVTAYFDLGHAAKFKK